MKSPLLLALTLAPLGCAGSEPPAAAPIAPPVVVDLTPPPVAGVAPKPAAKPEPVAEKPADDADPNNRTAAEFGIIGVLNSGDPNTQAALVPWGRDTGEGSGSGGLGLSGAGVGAGGGGRGEGIGLGTIGTLGHGGSGQGFGNGNGRLGGKPGARVRAGATTVNGRLPPEVIQRIIRQNFGRFRLCYQVGLQANAKLEGKIAVKFMIERDGSVSSTGTDAAGTTMADKNVVACVVRGFGNLSFPQPDAGKVSVVYPLLFSPPEDAPAPPPKPAAAPPPAAAPAPRP